MRSNPLSKSTKLDWLWLVLIGLVLQALLASRLQHPSYMDAYYYTTNGQRLADGFGFTEMIIWQFLDNPAGLPTPSHTYWMPLPSILAAIGYKLIGGFRGAQSAFVLLAGLLPWLSYAISQRISGVRWQAWAAALFTASGGFYVNYFPQPNTFAPFAVVGAFSLYALAKADQETGKPAMLWWLFAGLAVGLCHLTRADGLLLLLVGIIIWTPGFRQRPESGAYSRARHLSLFIAGYFVVMGWWFAHNLATSRNALSTVGTQTIFLTSYDDIFAYGRNFDLAHLWTWGGKNILLSRLRGMSTAAQTFIAVNCFIFLSPFILWSWSRLRAAPARWPWLRPMTWYALTLYAVMALVFTFPGERGGLFHSSAALWPWLMALAPAGIGLGVEWAAARLPHWKPQRAKPLFTLLFIIFSFAVSLVLSAARGPAIDSPALYSQIGAGLPKNSRVMVGNAPGFYYHTGLAAVSIPNDSTEIMLQAAEEYHITHLLLDSDRPQPLAALYNGSEWHPSLELISETDGLKLFLRHSEDDLERSN